MNIHLNTASSSRGRIIGALSATCITLSLCWSFVVSTATAQWPGSSILGAQMIVVTAQSTGEI
ncbi:MAG: hypothetical protein L6Q83_10150 [Gammaproteobacteria bacterium]|jgi:hypothetical protein|nr:hypothetical protein [Gammaproteobacteria bacterium]